MAGRSPAVLAQALAARTPLTFPQLQAALGGASRTTTCRYLRQVRYVRSYNHNGRYYTHRDPVRFDRHGLFSLGGAHFSRDGSLTATLQRLVREAAAGRTHRELRDLLHLSVHAVLLSAVRQGQLRRERLDGVWVYLSVDPERGAAQWQARRERRERRLVAEAAETLQPAVIIEVLLVLIRHPGSSPAQVTERLQGHVPPIRQPQVTAAFVRYELDKVIKKGGLAGC